MRAKRVPPDIWLIVLLAIFTAGIGVAIYLAIYYSKHEKTICVECNYKLKPITGDEVSLKKQFQPLENPYKLSLEQPISKEDSFLVGSQLELCPYCGQKMEKDMDVCPNCQSTIDR
ncbi:MAG: hypothetical protein BAJALOKI1v1_120004 [Promethearchaeota archaeon]|nr:MAG: hypothetical protein BAJALOKI1v1_120004 [Candidatus Lokiarchaeota archaeon]